MAISQSGAKHFCLLRSILPAAANKNGAGGPRQPTN